MPFWSRKTEQVPDWAEAMGERGLQGFYQLVGAELSRRGLSYKLGDGVALVGDPPTTCGLMNLAQVCQQTPGGEWAALITAHFDKLLNQPDVDALAADFEKVRSLIKVRLFPADYASQLQLVARPLAESVVAALVYDLPQSIATMHSGHPARLGKSADELFELGYANVREQDRPQVDDVDLGPAGKLRVLAGDSFFTATHALWIDAYLAPPAEHGALVAIPHRHVVIAYAIRNREVVKAVNTMIPLARKQFSQGPGSISPELYWWRAGSLVRLPSELQGPSIHFFPPEDFAQLVNRLAPA